MISGMKRGYEHNVSKGLLELSSPTLRYLLKVTSAVLKELPSPSIYNIDNLLLHQRLSNEEWIIKKWLQDRKYIPCTDEKKSSP